MTDKQTDVKTYNCVYCNKTLAKFETQPLYKDGKFMTTCEECWYKHAKEAGHVVSYTQAITINIDDLISGNLQDMEFTAQFGVYRQAVKELYDQNVRFKQALTEIKEIADLSIAHFDIDYLKQAINEILQKCEVLNDR